YRPRTRRQGLCRRARSITTGEEQRDRRPIWRAFRLPPRLRWLSVPAISLPFGLLPFLVGLPRHVLDGPGPTGRRGPIGAEIRCRTTTRPPRCKWAVTGRGAVCCSPLFSPGGDYCGPKYLDPKSTMIQIAARKPKPMNNTSILPSLDQALVGAGRANAF